MDETQIGENESYAFTTGYNNISNNNIYKLTIKSPNDSNNKCYKAVFKSELGTCETKGVITVLSKLLDFFFLINKILQNKFSNL